MESPGLRRLEAPKLSEPIKRESNNFDLLRLVLASLVMLFHAKILTGYSSSLIFLSLPDQAVEGFYVTSGFLVSASLERSRSLVSYSITRLFRLYPLYAAVILLQASALYILSSPLPGLNDQLLHYLAANLAFANFLVPSIGDALSGLPEDAINPSLWTLKVEVMFYFALPLLLWAARRLGWWVLPATMVASMVYWEWLSGSGQPVLARQLPGALQYFVIGIILYQWRRWLTPPGWWGLPALILCAAACIWGREWLPQPLYVVALGLFVVTAAFATLHVPLKGDISYGVYVLHAPVIQCLLLAGLGAAGFWVFLPIVVVLTLTLALLASLYIEQPGINLGRALSRRMFPPRVPPPQVPPSEAAA